MLNSLTLLWKVLSPLFHWCRRLDREKISHLPEGIHWLSIRDQIKPWHFLVLSSLLWRFCLLKKMLRKELKHIVLTLNMPPTVLSHPSAINTAMSAPACRFLCWSQHTFLLLLLSSALSHVHQHSLPYILHSISHSCGTKSRSRSSLRKAEAEHVWKYIF